MSDMLDDLRLAADFAPATEADWRKLVDGVLKGQPFEKLVGKTYDGIAIAPIYPRAQNTPAIATGSEGAPWQVMQRIDHLDAKQANKQALHDLENGATGLTLVFAGANGARGFGLTATPENIATLLDGIFLEAGIGIELNIGPESRMAATYLATTSRPAALIRPNATSASGSIRSAPAPSGAPARMIGKTSRQL